MLWTDLVPYSFYSLDTDLIMLESDHVLNEALFDNIDVFM